MERCVRRIRRGSGSGFRYAGLVVGSAVPATFLFDPTKWTVHDRYPSLHGWADTIQTGGESTLVGFTRYSRDQSFAVVGRNQGFLLMMAAGSIFGTFVGGQLLGVILNSILLPALAVILVLSALEVWRHSRPNRPAQW